MYVSIFRICANYVLRVPAAMRTELLLATAAAMYCSSLPAAFHRRQHSLSEMLALPSYLLQRRLRLQSICGAIGPRAWGRCTCTRRRFRGEKMPRAWEPVGKGTGSLPAHPVLAEKTGVRVLGNCSCWQAPRPASELRASRPTSCQCSRPLTPQLQRLARAHTRRHWAQSSLDFDWWRQV